MRNISKSLEAVLQILVIERAQEILCTQCFTVTRPKMHILKAAAAPKRVGSHCLGLSIGKMYPSLQNLQKRHLVLILEKVPRVWLNSLMNLNVLQMRKSLSHKMKYSHLWLITSRSTAIENNTDSI